MTFVINGFYSLDTKSHVELQKHCLIHKLISRCFEQVYEFDHF